MKKILHVSALLCFLLAFVLYVAYDRSGVTYVFVSGLILEVVAWSLGLFDKKSGRGK